MKKFIFMFLVLCTLQQSTHCQRDKDKRNLCIGAAAVLVLGYAGYKYYYSNSAIPTEPNKNEQNNDEKQIIELSPHEAPKVIILDMLNSPKKDKLSENNDPQANNHSDLSKKIQLGLEKVCANIHQADIEAIFVHNLGVLEG